MLKFVDAARNPSFLMIKIQKQKGNSDCGVFAISMALTQQTANCVLQQDLMRQYLSQCLQAKK